MTSRVVLVAVPPSWGRTIVLNRLADAAGAPVTLIARINGRELPRLLRELLPDRERVPGPDHPDILTTRANIAYWARMQGEQ
jgi:hypothetical protein